MKRVLYILAAMIFITSCQSVNKMIESGNYEGAILHAMKKIRGDKRKSTKNIQYLEEAYAKALKRDVDRIGFLNDLNRPENYDEVYDIYANIKSRQEAMMPFLPLVSKDGYKAEFRFLKVDDLMKEASKLAAAYHYKVAKDLLDKAELGDKYAARRAYDRLREVNKHFRHYDNIDELRNKALFLGTKRVLMRTENRSLVAMPIGFQDALLGMNLNALEDRWTEYYTIEPSHADIDVVAEIEIREFFVGPEREFVREFRESKKVQDGWEYVLDRNGNVKKDTLGNDIKKKRYIDVFANIVELKRTKEATVGGIIKFYDAKTTEVRNVKQFTVASDFCDFACSFRGDKRALSSNTKNRIKSFPLPFPTNESLALDAAGKLKGLMAQEIKRFMS